MENVPTEISLVEGVDPSSLPSDGLTFAVGEDDTGLNYAYIIHLPVDAMHHVHEQIVTDNNIVTSDNENKFTAGDVFTATQQCVNNAKTSNSVIMLPVSTTTNNTPVTTPITTNLTIPPRESTLLPNNHSGPESRPIEIQYLEEGVFLHEGEKCDVENLILDDNQEVPSSDLKFDPLLDEPPDSNSVTVYGVLPESDQEGIMENEVEESFQIVEQPVSNSELETGPECLGTKSEVIPYNQVNPISHPVPKRNVRTYGKPKADKLPAISNVTSSFKDPPILPPSIQPLAVPHISQESRRVTKIVRIAEVHVKQPQRIAIHIPAKKRRLIVDSQKQIPISDFKRQLVNTKDILHARSELAPGTKKGMKYLELGSVPQFFSSPGRPILNLRLSRLFTNHLIVVTGADNNASEFTPLNADLKFPTPVENDDDTNDFTKNGKLTAKPLKRLINVGRPLDGYFKGLRKPPVLKQYTRIQRKPTGPNGTKKTPSSEPPTSTEKVKSPFPGTQTIKIEEAVYTVEDGESVVLKSHGIVLAQSNSIEHSHTDDDIVLIASVEKEEEDEIKEEISPSVTSSDFADLEIKLEDPHLSMSPVPQEVLNSGSGSNNVDNVKTNSVDDLKLWGYQVSSS